MFYGFHGKALFYYGGLETSGDTEKAQQWNFAMEPWGASASSGLSLLRGPATSNCDSVAIM